ncbi:hypothetical protein U5B43_08965 [Campylobacter sp. 9BO]|uniref:hypothetical protein n=1 Tax=Campylobacter sp. 9BO TaxID=3424759 RepID=UPI003D3405C9
MTDEKEQIGELEKVAIKLTIQRDEPLDIAIFSKALLSLNNAIDEYVTLSSGTNGIKTTLQGVEKGSDIIYLMITGALMFDKLLPNINEYFTFFSNIKNICKCSVDDIRNDKFLTPSALNDIENVVNLANQSGVSVTINYNNYKDCLIINQENKESYKQGLNTARQIKGDIEQEQVKKVYQKMSITLYQTTNTDKKVKFKAFCYELSHNAIPILIDDEALKAEILESPYTYRFVCDIEIHKDAKGKISLYRAFNYIDKFEIIKD